MPTLRSEDNRLELTATTLRVHDQRYSLLELEAAELTPVRWLLWYMLGALVLAGVLLAFLQNWLRTLPTALGLTVGALLLIYGNRGTNRLRLHRAGREAAHFSLPGDLATWLPLLRELNRRIRAQHDAAAAHAAQLLATLTPPDAAPETPPTDSF
ncbi:hypothetical protein F1C16_06585 [Hymenobacter sp. NBH84]|uniref:hypothetical protein n=1 Tax=Hymenobacter sp. NBH84 TaxID=2596915 RepID=UPI0016254B28|nr:hypothetical protein [Hymenobacter sp. NBH84]QNE39249.1 hypothetical protein F1C16_06585 [Hymenobacter sp. NBH84]